MSTTLSPCSRESVLFDAPETFEIYDRSELRQDLIGEPEVVAEGWRLSNVHIPTLSVYLPPKEKAMGCGVMVCPGGGYHILAAGHEGRDIARWLNDNGVAAFVLRYRLPPNYRHPTPRDDARQGLRQIRRNAKRWGVDAARIGMLGFSAGGHLTSSVMTQLEGGEAGKLSRPDFGVLLYPVITMSDGYGHGGSRDALLGPDSSAAARFAISSEVQVTLQTPPAFIVHSMDDGGVPVRNSIEFALALKRAGVAVETHLFSSGGHGYGMGKPGTLESRWPGLCIEWMRGMKFMGH